jgi:hypothetical protein
MVFSVKCKRDLQRLPIQTLRFRIVTKIVLNGSEVDQVIGNMWMALTIKLLVHREYSLVERLGHGVVTGIKLRVG